MAAVTTGDGLDRFADATDCRPGRRWLARPPYPASPPPSIPNQPSRHRRRHKAGADGRSEGSSTPQDTNRQPTQDGTQEAVGEEVGWLFQRRLGPVEPGCGSPFVMPGESVGLSASGFAPFSEVDISVIAAVLPDTLLGPVRIPAVTADGQGIIDIVWVVPEAPPSQEDPAPRAYAATAEGTGWNGGTFTAYMIDPLVAYPGTAPCAVEDFVAAAFGEPVRVDVLANDVAPAGGSLDPATVEVLAVRGGELEADPSDATVVFVPDAGFAATTTANYRIYDHWGIGVQGEVTISVDAGCTIYAVEGVVDVAGTDRDDVICAADLAELDTFDDNATFHIIDAGAGDDVIFASKGTDWVYGGDGDDIIFGREGADRIFGGDGYSRNNHRLAETPPGDFTQVAVGSFHACGLDAAGAVICWGENSAAPIDAPAGEFSDLSSGQSHSCALAADATIRCWGDNSRWQSDSPPGTFAAVSAGGEHTCALRGDGAAECWGNNDRQQSDAPEGVFASVSAGDNHACGLRGDGSAVCWGRNDEGQSEAPSGVFLSVSAGWRHSCGVRPDASVVCWGSNEGYRKFYGQATPPAGRFMTVSAGGDHS